MLANASSKLLLACLHKTPFGDASLIDTDVDYYVIIKKSLYCTYNIGWEPKSPHTRSRWTHTHTFLVYRSYDVPWKTRASMFNSCNILPCYVKHFIVLPNRVPLVTSRSGGLGFTGAAFQFFLCGQFVPPHVYRYLWPTRLEMVPLQW
jgi:hypothetical protein